MPVITVSRMYGSGGSALAEIVARTMGWTLYDNQIVDEIAARSGLPRAEVSSASFVLPAAK